ncbi:hypothetical protein BCR33DRAFT_659273 [Rhizoclosmatium globosum]|uniref:Fe2OG dioxygenase domain-containing protein n=1 Tax=Rhizoclosmatium globosum TaxID=329046 RepID=A0A1Y2CDS1_9FUNG|nr:hypothetical protein BCR33DRAFT_659273 [Rhizoclosmatium globosum]|eukprot:ORY45183.1 hypothetical protein BCR33DRAFT_659273 [Rhizoclosmatium globosum]
MLALEPHLRALFEPDIGANQAMRFGNALPSFLDPLLGIAKALLPSNLQSRTPAFDQMIANHYSPGEGIVEHVDLARFEDGVVIFSFLSPLVMDFRYVGQASTSDSYSRDAFPEIENAKHIALLLEAGSAVCLSGESRFNWAHGIKETLSDEFQGRIITRKERISITLRKMKPNQSSEMNSIGNQDNATRQ